MLLFIAQLPFSAKFSPPPKQPSTREREYLRTSEINAMIPRCQKSRSSWCQGWSNYFTNVPSWIENG